MNKKGQGSIEYLLIIGAVILIVAIVIVALISLAGTATDGAGETGELTDAQLMADCFYLCTVNNHTWADMNCSAPDNTWYSGIENGCSKHWNDTSQE